MGILGILVTIFSESSENYQNAKEKFGNRYFKIVYLSGAVSDKNGLREVKKAGKGDFRVRIQDR
jgi:hypothetical protein